MNKIPLWLKFDDQSKLVITSTSEGKIQLTCDEATIYHEIALHEPINVFTLALNRLQVQPNKDELCEDCSKLGKEFIDIILEILNNLKRYNYIRLEDPCDFYLRRDREHMAKINLAIQQADGGYDVIHNGHVVAHYPEYVDAVKWMEENIIRKI